MKKLLQLKIVLLFFLFIGSMQYVTAQNSYKYLRFSIDELGGSSANPDVHIGQIRWKMGNALLPVSSLKSFGVNANGEPDPSVSENEEVALKSSFSNFLKPPHKAFEDDGYETYTSKTTTRNGVTTNNLPALLTLNFKKAPIYVTGVEVTLKGGYISKFTCYGSNDGANWVSIYSSPTLTWHDYYGSNNGVYVANFSNSIPGNADTQAPSTPSGLSVGSVSNLIADINWNASSDAGVGVLLYEIFVNGALWQTSNTTSTKVYGLSKQSNYTVQVKAVDAYGNRSSLSGSQSISTGTYPQAIRKIGIGTGIGHSNGGTGIFKASPNFAADWRSQSESTGPFSQAFINDMKKFSHIRFMDVLGINYNKIENWNDRIQANDPNQIQKYSGEYKIMNKDVLSYEWAIYLCNVTNRNMWLNVPANANENFVKSLATLVKNNLNSNLKVYLENGNETWGGFEAFDEYKIQGQKPTVGFGSGTIASHRYMVYKTLKVFKWFKANMGTQQNRVITVLSGQFAEPYVSKNHRDALKDQTVYPAGKINPDNVMPDLYAVAPYFDIGGEANDDGYTRMKKSIDEKIALTQEHYNIWNPENVELTCYEGGIHDHDGIRSTFSHDKGIYNAYLYYLDQLAPYYTVFSQYSYTFGSNNSNNFGAIDFVGQPLIDAPKIRALFDWIDVNKNNELGNVPPVFYSDPKNITVPNGVKDITFAAAALSPIQSYQWYKNNASITGEVLNSYTSANRVGLADSGTQYKTKAINAFGSTFSSSATLTVVNHHLDISKATTAPTIDGSVDGMWSSISSQNIANANKGTTSGNADLSGNFKTTWDANNLYLLVQVTDDILIKDATGTDGDKYNYDGIEIYINDDNAYTDGYNNDAQFVYNWEGGIHSFSGGKSIAGIQVGQTNTANGYIMEVAIPWTTFGVTPQNGSFIGFDVFIVDKDIPGTSEANEKKAWHSLVNDSWDDPREFASVKLTDGTSTGTAPTITSQPVNVSVGGGSNATFTVTASGSGLTYQWFKETTAISGATSNSLTIGTVSTADVGDYHVVVSNTEGSVTSTTVTLSIDTGGTDTIISINGPSSISIGETITVTVPYTASTTRKMYFELKATDNSAFHINLNRLVNAGSGTETFTFTVPNGVNLNKNHTYVAFITKENTVISPWQDRFDYKMVPVTVTASTNPNTDTIVSINGPSSVSIGETITVTVPYTASTTRKMYFELKATDNSEFPVNETRILSAGSGTETFTFTVPNGINLVKNHTYVAFITKENTVISPWQDRFDYKMVPVTVTSSGTGGNSYRYLRVTFNDYSNFKLRELNWITAGGSVPSSAMTSNSSAGVIASNSQGWSTFNVFDDVYTDTGYWIGNGTTPKSVTLDLGSNPVTPTGIDIYKAGWATLNGFKAEGSNDNSNWTLLLNKTSANGDFVTTNLDANAVVGTFNFSATKSSQKKNIFDGVKVYPNPVTNFLNVNLPIEINGSLIMSLTSVAGKIVWKRKFNSSDSNNQIDVSRLASGLYFLELKDNLNTYQYKIIKN